MVSKNNFRNKMEAEAKRVPHFGLRKLSVGVASVLLSTTLYFGVTAHADTNVVTADSNQDNVTAASGSVKQEYQGSKVALGSNTAGSANGQSAVQSGAQSSLQSNSQLDSQSGSQASSQSAVQSGAQSGLQANQAPVVGQQDNKTKQTLNTLLDATSRYNGNLYIQSLAVATPSMNPGDTVKYQAGTAGVNDSFNRYVTRTIHVVKPDNTKLAYQTQTIHFVREDANGNAGTVQDDMTIKYVPWVVLGADGRPTTQTLGHFDEVALPKIPGYAAEDQQGSSIVDVTKGTVAASVVSPYMVNQEVTVVYRALGTNKPIHLVDTKTGQVVADLSVTGVPGQVINIDQTVPDGYKLAAGQSIPKSVTIDPNDVSPMDIKVDELVVDIPASSPVNAGDSVPGTQHVKFTSGLSEADLNRTVTRTVTIVPPKGQSLPAGVEATHTDTVSFHRNAHFNAVTGAITYDAWTENGQHTFAQVDAPAFDGYRVNWDDVSGNLVVTPDNQNITGEITYVPVAEGATIHFYDPTLGGQQADQVINFFTVPVDDDQGGTTGTPFTLNTDDLNTNLHNLDMDDYFEIDPGTTVSGTYGPNQEYYVAVKHRIFKIDYSNLDQSSWTMPDGDTVPSKITIGAIDRKINRRVHVNPPKGHTLPNNIQLQEQHAEFVRDAYVDMGLIYEDGDKEADNVTTFGSWHTAIVDPTSGRVTGINNDSASVGFSGIVAPEITGYTPDKSAGAVTVTPDTVPEDITINYVANDHQGKISYVDGDMEVHSDQISGKSEAQIEVTPVAPTGYEFDEGQGAAQVVTVPASGDIPMITVHVHHKIINVTPDYPVVSNGQTDTKQPIKGAHESDLNQTITRTIRVTDPQGKVTTQTQSVHLTRTATYDDVTGDVTYGQWITGTWDEYTAPAITGYTPSQKVSAVTVTDGTKDTTVDVTYNPIQQNAKIIYQDANNADLQVGFTAISGRTGESVTINPVAPTGFEIVPGQSTPFSVIVPADGLHDVTVEVQHKHVTVQPGDLPKPGDNRPGNSNKKPGDGTPNQDITYDSLHRNMTRTIKVTDPYAGLKTTKVTLNYQRTATIDDVTGKVTYSDWTVVAGSPAGFDAFNIPNVPGYTSKIDSGTLEELMPLNPTQDQITNWQDQTINIIYTANNQSFTIDYVDSQGQPVTGGHFVVSGVTGQAVPTNAKIPTGWELMPDQTDAPTIFTFDGTKAPQDLTIKIQHKIINVPYSQNPKVDPRTDKTDTNQPINGGQKFDWTKSVTRTVNIYDPHSGVKTTTQVANLHRDANYDDVTGAVTYGDWSVDNTSWTEVDIPTIPGYATDDGQTQVPSMSVDGKTADKTIDVTYSTADQVTHINYVGPDGKTVVKSYTVAGKTDQTVDVTAPIPTGWVLAPGAKAAPKQITFTGASTPDRNIKIVHGTTQITHDHPAQPGAKTPTGKDITGASQDDLNQTITRTITVHEPGKDANTITQTAKIFRDATVDDVTGEVTYTAWSTDATDWAEYDAPVHAGYTVSQAKVDAVTVADGQKNVTVDITYTAKDQVGEIVYVDVDGNNAEVGHTDLAGKTDDIVTISPKAPAGYDIVSGQNIPATEVAGPDGIPKVTVKVSRHKVTVTPDQEPKPGDKISGNPDKQPGDGTPKTDVSYETLHRDMTRTINVTDPHTGLHNTTVVLHYNRTATIDDVTGEVTYGNWTVSDGSAAGFDVFDIPAVAGYTSEIKSGTEDDLKALTPSQDQITNWTDQTVDIDYTANDQSMTIDYVDKDGHPVDGGHFVVSGKTDQTVNTNAKIPAGWVLSQGQSDAPKTITFTGKPTANVKITVEHGIKNVMHDDPLKIGDKTPTDVTINGAHEDDLNQTITRTINITKPGEKTQTTTQTAKIFRDATVDEVTGKVTYGDWSTDDTDWTQVDVPSLPGYTTHQSDGQTGIPAVTVKDGQKDVTINVTYSVNEQSMDINYVDQDGHKIATFHVTGHTDETVNTNAKIPAGWVLAKGQTDAPGSVTFFGAHTDDVNVVIEHGTHQVKHDSPENSGATTLSGKVINGAHQDDLNKTITRTINVTTPDGQTTTTHQNASIYRDATVDDVTGEVAYGAWSTSFWDNFKPKVIDGYTTSQADVPQTAVTSDTESATVNITYTANAQTSAINYMINGEVIKSTSLNGVTDQTLTGLTYTAPDGYEIVEGQDLPTEYKFKAKDNAPIVVQLVHKQQLVVHFVGLDGIDIKGVASVTVDGVTGQVVTVPKSAMPAGYQMLAGQNIPDTFMLNDNDDNYLSIIVTPIMVTVKGSAPVKTGDVIPNTNGAKYPAGLTQADLIKTITRTIYIAKPDGKMGEVVQMVKFSRDATLNAATGEISYDVWVPSSRQDFEAYTPEVIDGFTVESAPSQVVTPESQDSEITLTYKQIPQAKAPIYIDNQGHALDKIPDGYHVVPGQVTDKGGQLVVKDHQVVVPKVEYVTRTITVTMPNGKTRTITQRARRGTKFVAAHLPHLKGYTAEVTVGGTYGVTDANSDVVVSVHFVKNANK